MGRMAEVVIDERDEHDADIKLYIQDELKLNHQDLQYELRRKAAGIFMWVILVVKILNKGYDEGDGIKSMMEKLRDVPSDLAWHSILESSRQR